MANPSAVAASIGTQRQFAKAPESVYQKRLIEPQFGRGISISADQGAELLAQSLGVLGENILKESIAADQRMREQFTAEDAARMLAGKTSKDLKDFDIVNALQHSDKGFNLTDNPYAMANLERGMGQIIARGAREQWHSEFENSPPPKTMQEAVKRYNEILSDSYNNFNENERINNKYAFDQGFYEGYQDDVIKVAHLSHQRINAEYQAKGQRMISVKMQDLVRSATEMSSEDFKNQFSLLARELQSYTPDSETALKIINKSLSDLVQNDVTTEKLNSTKDVAFFGDRKIGDELPMFDLYKQVADNFNVQQAEAIYEACMRPDGTLDFAKSEKMLADLSTKSFIAKTGVVPKVDLKLSEGDNPDVKNLSTELKTALPFVGGLLANLGYKDAMITSGYREGAMTTSGNVSYHASGNAVDIWLGDGIDRATGDKIAAEFKPFFKECLWEKEGDATGATGDHLHLGGYKGGFSTGNGAMMQKTAASYSYERIEKIKSILKAKHSDAIMIAKQKEGMIIEDTLQKVSSAASEEEALAAIKESGLSPMKQQTLMNKIKMQYRRIAKESLTPEQQYYITYEKRNMFKDMMLLKEYQDRVADEKDVIEETEQKKYNAAAHRINDYWKYASGGAYQPNKNKDSELPPSPTPVVDDKEVFKAQLKKIADKAIADGMPQNEVETKIIGIASKYGLDGVYLVNEWYPAERPE